MKSLIRPIQVKAFILLLLLPVSLGLANHAQYAVAGNLKRTLPTGVSGQDQRRPMKVLTRPWTAVGRVNHNGGFCSGTLIAPDRVLTAVHCVWDRKAGTWQKAGALEFLAGYFQGEHLARRSVSRITRPKGVKMNRKGRLSDQGKDWVVLTLTSPINNRANLKPIPLAREQDLSRLTIGSDLLQAGYSLDQQNFLTVVDSCQLLANAQTRAGSQLILHDCDTTHGDSGSPVMMRVDDDLRVVGVHVATYPVKGKQLGIAVRLPETLLE